MAFVNEEFTPEDRARYHFDDFDREQVDFPNPDRYWVIDREAGIFLRLVKATVGDHFDPASRLENQFHFHFHRHGYDYLVHIRTGLWDGNLAQFPGTPFVSSRELLPGCKQFVCYLRLISERVRPSPGAPSALRHQRQAVLSDLEAAMDASFSGDYLYMSPEEREVPRHFSFIIAPDGVSCRDGGPRD
ncbi:hypothetical protein C3432_11695 [Citrobacter amalonaticus]|uniref:Uncharacterized protein n=1 Tax=Citrobacter amalonaticus TaxID=35703 RepID=A0A2S4RPV8_CITAM|nr:hypothetical protein [Citrobacter amalonaticus]POT58538.1 hypothetical protein C3432_11695 [Citrobacter amalonaticus]POT75936.1 hypothetical protein C3436_00120 [Citrobacter amalonaticus]POU59102.1 hypothetical protein C3430_26880 [Citrobacter amalonaticus]POV05171.1 hypothetical protein C3424_07425 [Citrobacter amalonaticus]